MNIKNKLSNILVKHNKYVKFGEDLLTAYADMKNTSILHKIHAGLRTINQVTQSEVLELIDKSIYREVEISAGTRHSCFLYNVIMANSVIKAKKANTDGSFSQSLIEFRGMSLACSFQKYYYSPKAVIYRTHDFSDKDVITEIAKLLWELSGSKIDYTIEGDQCTPVISPFRIDERLWSVRSQQILDRINPFWSKGLNRSVMLLGNPGTGKTTMMNALVNKLSGLCVVMTPDAKAGILGSDIDFVCKLLHPDILLINDFDRVAGDQHLTALETINKYVKLLVVSVNATATMTSALKRPGRFDEIFTIDTLGDEAMSALLVKVPDVYRETVKTWPIAFIKEFDNRLTNLDNVNPEAEFNDLNERVKTNT